MKNIKKEIEALFQKGFSQIRENPSILERSLVKCTVKIDDLVLKEMDGIVPPFMSIYLSEDKLTLATHFKENDTQGNRLDEFRAYFKIIENEKFSIDYNQCSLSAHLNKIPNFMEGNISSVIDEIDLMIKRTTFVKMAVNCLSDAAEKHKELMISKVEMS